MQLTYVAAAFPANLHGAEQAYAARCVCLLSKSPMHATFREILSQLWISIQESAVKPLLHPLEDCTYCAILAFI